METEGLEPKDVQQKVTDLMHSRRFLVEVAEACDRAYNESQGNFDSHLLTDDERDVLLGRVVATPEEYKLADDKVDRNLPGFYALQETVFMVADESDRNPFEILENLASENPDPLVLNKAKRMAHATWLSAASFRNRNTQGNVMVFDQLPEGEKEKDIVQIQTSARVLLKHITEL